MALTHLIRCRCGKFQAELSDTLHNTRAVCYCRDCQAYGHFLGPPPGMLDEHGGTDIIAVAPRQVNILQGREYLGCMSLTATGVYRWYTSCCRTPVGNTPRDFRQSHVGLVHNALESRGGNLDAIFGPVRMRVFRNGAHGEPEANRPLAFLFGVLRHLGFMTRSRLSGKYKINPFFDTATGKPIVTPIVLSAADHEKFQRAASGS
jgi:hypothetical protein